MKKSIQISKIFMILVPLLAAPVAFADVGMRLNGSVGAWNGAFHQADTAGHEVNIRTLTSLGLQLGVGVDIGLVFIDYNATWFLSNHTLSPSLDPYAQNTPSNREGPYFSPLGFSAGLDIPLFPVKPYIGIEKGTFGFTAGAKTGYSGLTGKLGVNVKFLPGFGVRLEYRRLYAGSDDAGDIPASAGVTTQFSCWYLGLVAGKF